MNSVQNDRLQNVSKEGSDSSGGWNNMTKKQTFNYNTSSQVDR